MQARNRTLQEWYGKVRNGEIKLPRFQRFEAWDSNRITSLLQVVINNLPLGITLILEVGDEERFISRYLETAPQTGNRVSEHLLDGQQRLTALWRAFHNNYEWETYFVYLSEFDEYDKDEARENMSVYARGRYVRKNGERYPRWCDEPANTLARGFIPTNLLQPEDIQGEIDAWLEKAVSDDQAAGDVESLKRLWAKKKRVSDCIRDLRAIVANYNLPFLALPARTDKTVALNVFINMNTNSKPLSTYDIIVAEVESVMGMSLHDLESQLDEKHPEIRRYAALSDIILTTSALIQGLVPNQSGAWNMDKRKMVANWPLMEKGLTRMAAFLKSEGILDEARLPTNAVLAVIGALYARIPDSGDKRGSDEQLLKRYLWHAFFTDRYENAAATHAYADFVALQRVITGKQKDDGTPYVSNDVPIFAEHELVEAEELCTAEWPKGATIRGRAVLAVACRLGALDFVTGERLDVTNLAARHYHHVFPDALLKEAGVDSYYALNCALISDKSNQSIGRKDPLKYLIDRYEWTSEEIVRERLESHLIPSKELANGGYEGLSGDEKREKVKNDFTTFKQKRSELVMRAVNLLIEGRQLSAAEIFTSVEDSSSI